MPRAIDSVRSQTQTNWELWIIDDGSIDESGAIARSFEQQDSRIHLIQNRVPLGVHNARNRGLEAARGRWVAFIDSDDEWLPTKLERTVSFAENKSSPLTFTGYRSIDTSGSRVGNYIEVPPIVDYTQLLTLNVIVTSSVLVDRKLTGAFAMRDVTASDFVCWLKILKEHKYAHGLSEDLVRYRLTPGSLSRNKLKVASKIWKIYRTEEKLNFFSSVRTLLTYVLKSGKKYLDMRIMP